jgi:hypothetical protein
MSAPLVLSALPVCPIPSTPPPGPARPDPAHAQAVIDVIARAVGLVDSGAAAGLCTAADPQEGAEDGAGFAFPGHTEYLCRISPAVARAVMMLAGPDLRVVPGHHPHPAGRGARGPDPRPAGPTRSASPPATSCAISASPRPASPWPG